MSGKFQQRDEMAGPSDCPPWLCAYNSNAQKFQYVLGLAMDALLEKSDEAQSAKLPGQSDPSCIPLQAADRLLVQGPAESNTSFTARLTGAFQAWARAGSRPAVLGQIQAYLTDLQPGVVLSSPECLIVGGNTSTSTWSTIFGTTPQGDPPAQAVVSPPNWDWDGEDKPTRAWLVLFMQLVDAGLSGAAGAVASVGGSGVTGVTSGFATLTGLAGLTASVVGQYLTMNGAPGNKGAFQIVAYVSATSCIVANPSASVQSGLAWSIAYYPYIAPAPVWGSPEFVWGAGTWGVSCSEQVIISIRQILQRWKSARTYYPKIIVSFGGWSAADAPGGTGVAGDDFSPLSSQGVGNPDGTWGTYGKNVAGCWVPSRTPQDKPFTGSRFTAFCDGTGTAIRCYEKNRT